jgi:hypothetical protein
MLLRCAELCGAIRLGRYPTPEHIRTGYRHRDDERLEHSGDERDRQLTQELHPAPEQHTRSFTHSFRPGATLPAEIRVDNGERLNRW